MLTHYLNYISLERGLSDNTRQAYEHDVRLFLDYLADEELRPEMVKLDNLHRFAWQLHDMGIAPRSVARVLSGVRSFYHFLLVDGYIEADPTELLESPKIGRHLPEVLSVEEIDMKQTAADFGINFIKMEVPTNEEIAKKVSERVRAKLEQEKNHFGGQKARERISRVIPLVKELANGTEEDQMLLAYLVDRYAWKK